MILTWIHVVGFKPPRVVNSYLVDTTRRDVHMNQYRGGTRSLNSQNRPKYYSTSSIGGKLHFPSRTEVLDSVTPQRRVRIPAEFSSADMYKNVLTEAVHGKLSSTGKLL